MIEQRESADPHRASTLGWFLALLASLSLSLPETLSITRLWQDPASSTGTNEMVTLVALLTVFPVLLMMQAILLGAWFARVCRLRRRVSRTVTPWRS